MADRIYVTYTPTVIPGCYHTTVHYERRDMTGNIVRHVTIEGQPERVAKMSVAEKVDGVLKEVFREDDDPSNRTSLHPARWTTSWSKPMCECSKRSS
jgi:hypothetical protein